MAEPKTKKNDGDVQAFLDSIENEKRRVDAIAIDKLMTEVMGEPGHMWGKSIVGYGSYHYVYASGCEGDWMQVGFSPRKAAMSVYIMPGFDEYGGLMEKLGKHKIGKSCLYIKKLEDVDQDVLKKLVKLSAEHIKAINS